MACCGSCSPRRRMPPAGSGRRAVLAGLSTAWVAMTSRPSSGSWTTTMRTAAPLLDPAEFPDGANVEVTRVTGDRHAEMRVYERGSGPTRSCGTGAVAAAVAAAIASAAPGTGTGSAVIPDAANGTWTVDVPGGRLAVTLLGTASLLTGPAVIVAEGELDDAWLASAGADGS